MLGRLRQVAYYLAPRLTAEDREWALGFLNPAQQALFSAMGRADQAHAVRVARRLHGRQAPAYAIEAALLHDCAKPADYNLFWRCFGVLMGRWLPVPQASQVDGWPRMLRVYHWHDLDGLRLAEAAGTSPEAIALLAAYTGQSEEAPAWLEPLEVCDDLG
ncbi:MAG TPA: hypothetical protein V6D47_13815 [Oscillatoriaceae cyanobacterium]